MSANQLDAMGKTNRLLMPFVGAAIGLIVIAGWFALGQAVLSSRPETDRDWARLISIASALAGSLVSCWYILRKKSLPRVVYFPIWLGCASGAAYHAWGLNGVAWGAIAFAVLGLITLVAFRKNSATQFGRAGLEE